MNDSAGRDAASLDHRVAQATKVYGKWKKVMTCRRVAPLRRARLLYISAFTSALWLSECWNPSQALLKRLDSWGARTLALAYGVRKSVDEDGVQFWRRLHRFGHELYRRLGGSLVKLRTSKLHRWAGHLARSQDSHLRKALRTRCLAWWRFFQHPTLPLHQKRFGRPSRWEGQMTKVYGEVADDNPESHDVGWMALAQD